MRRSQPRREAGDHRPYPRIPVSDPSASTPRAGAGTTSFLARRIALARAPSLRPRTCLLKCASPYGVLPLDIPVVPWAAHTSPGRMIPGPTAQVVGLERCYTIGKAII